MGSIFNKIIRIAQISSDNGRFKIRSADGDLYSFFQFKQGGKVPTQAYEHFMTNNHGQQFNQEDMALIGYTETEGTTKQGQTVTYKNIISMFPSDAESRDLGNKQPQAPKVPSSGQSLTREANIESREAFGKRLAMHGFVNSRLVNGSVEGVTRELPQLMELELNLEQTLSGQKTINPEEIPF